MNFEKTLENLLAAVIQDPLITLVVMSMLLVGLSLYAVIVVAQSFANNKGAK